MATVKNRGAEFILANILDPNREVDPKYINYIATTDDGRIRTGIIVSETATSVTLLRGEGIRESVLRVAIDELQSTNQSIMPEGLEQQLDRQAVADLLAYLLLPR